jgi:hypothetical protein
MPETMTTEDKIKLLVEEHSLADLETLLTEAGNILCTKIQEAKAEHTIVRKAYDLKLAKVRLAKRFEGMSAEELALLQDLQPAGVKPAEPAQK